MKEHSSEHFEKVVGTHEISTLISALKTKDDKHIKGIEIGSNERRTAIPTTTAAAAAAAAAARTGVTSIESQKTATNNLSDLIDRTLIIHTTHKTKIVKILTFEINVPKEGSQWSRYRKNVAENKLNFFYKNSNNDKNKVNQEVKLESSKSVACVQAIERTWGISTINFIATVDHNGKILDELKCNESLQLRYSQCLLLFYSRQYHAHKLCASYCKSCCN